jgi:hypothetical protein
MVGSSPTMTISQRRPHFCPSYWRITFRVDQDDIEIVDLDYEDYH